MDDRFSVVVLSNLAEAEPECLADTISGIYLAGGVKPACARSTLIVNATVIDGTGAPPRRESVRIIGDRIVEVGRLSASPEDSVVDADGLVLAPGFIDTHSHVDDDLLEHPEALAAISQGITTAIVGQDGGSPHPLSEYFFRFDEEGAAINLALAYMVVMGISRNQQAKWALLCGHPSDLLLPESEAVGAVIAQEPITATP